MKTQLFVLCLVSCLLTDFVFIKTLKHKHILTLTTWSLLLTGTLWSSGFASVLRWYDGLYGLSGPGHRVVPGLCLSYRLMRA